MKFRFFLLFFCTFITFSFAQEERSYNEVPPIIADSVWKTQYDYVRTDSILEEYYTTENTISSRKFEENFRSKYKGDEFNYETVKPRESLWDRIKRRIGEILEAIFGKMEPNTSVTATKSFLWFLAIVAGGFIIYFLLNYLLNKEGNFFFSKKNKKNRIDLQEISENIHEIDFNQSILKFENDKNYRSAIRFHFLHVLKKLSDRKIIDWNPEKTNKDYLNELQNSELKESFRELAFYFDYVWYGEFDIDENTYLHFREKFKNIKIK